jgi:hypothetical protein
MIGRGGYPLAEIPPVPTPGTHQLPQSAHFDRALHLAYGLLLIYPICEIVLCVKGRDPLGEDRIAEMLAEREAY